MFTHYIKNLLWICLLCGAAVLSASDTEANTFFAQGREKEKASSFRKAARCFMDAHFMADSPVLRGNALIASARANRKAKLYGAEFDCLKKLLREHLSGINFTQVVERIYTIGDLYFAGHRDLFVDWLPFIQKDDRTLEIYEAALAAAPCYSRAPETRLRLARLYIDEQKTADAIRHLREIGKLHGGTNEGKFAMLELCSLLNQMSERGDGDSSYAKQTIESCDNYSRLYGATPENKWVEKTRQEVRNRIASRLHSTGSYYYKSGKKALAERYLANVVREYPDTVSAKDSEALLAQINSEFEVPAGNVVLRKEAKEKLEITSIPKEDQPIMVTPEESKGKWLLPVRDLKRSMVVNTAGLRKDNYLRFPVQTQQKPSGKSEENIKGGEKK